MIAAAGLETGIVMLLIGTRRSSPTCCSIDVLRRPAGRLLQFTDNKYVFLLVVNLLLLAVGIFIEPLPALYILAPFLAPVAVMGFGVDPVHFGLIMVFNLVLALIHPPIGLVLFLVSSIAKVSIERLSIMILPWLAVSLVVLFLVTYLPSEVVLALSQPGRAEPRQRPRAGRDAGLGGGLRPLLLADRELAAAGRRRRPPRPGRAGAAGGAGRRSAGRSGRGWRPACWWPGWRSPRRSPSTRATF